MMRSAFILAALAVACGCSQPLKPAEKEEARRAELELQSVMDMASSRKVSPVEFELGSSRLLPSSFPLLDRVADVLLRYNRLKLIVSGHTDDSGSAGFNENLSMERAGAVKMYLVKKGVYPESIKVYGYGSKLPALKENSDRARALNRRVEFRITTRDWSTVY
jgi:outer membrane protein OmpA-like peptidoglycan-associated protein